MNKKLFLKLGLVTLVAVSSLSLVACGEKNTSTGTINPTSLNADKATNTDKNSEEKDDTSVSSPEKNEQKDKQKTESSAQKSEEKPETIIQETEQKSETTDKKVKQETQNAEQKLEEKYKELDRQHAQLKTTEEKEVFYYNKITDAKQRQIDYINSLKDPIEKQSVQSSLGAAVSESTFLMMRYPEDSEIIENVLSKINNPAEVN